MWNRPLVTMLLGAIAAVLMPVLVVKGSTAALIPGTGGVSHLQTWLLLVAIQALAWVFITAWMIPNFARIWPVEHVWGALTPSIAGVSVLSAVFFWIIAKYLGADFPPTVIGGVPIVRVVTPVASLVAAASIFGLLLCYYSLPSPDSAGSPVSWLAAVASRLELMNAFLFCAGIVIALGIAGTAAIRNAVEADHQGAFPREYIALFGMIESGFLLLPYLAIRIRLHQDCQEICRTVLGPEPSSIDDLKRWRDNRALLSAILGQDSASGFGLAGYTSSLLPLLAGLLNQFLRA
jgi:hypothetical protein